MNTSLLRRLRRLFTNEFSSRSQTRHNIRQWVKSRKHLGGSYLLYDPFNPRQARRWRWR